jgi:two-component system, chemotaxis family, CheB/CheR fusion protein
MVSAEQAPNASEFPVVAIGASAGGITALQTLFKAISGRPSLAFVVVQHLLPDQPSQLATLIGSWTALPVREACDGLKLECNCIFVTPPGQALALENGVFTTKPLDRAGPRAGIDVIDSFFESLAEDAGRRAIAVVLSGTGADGAAGAIRIKQAGGMVLVQDPVTAMHDGMPSAAIGNGAADHVMPLGALAQELIACAAPDYVRSSTASWADDVTKALDGIIDLIRTKAGFDLTGYKTTPLLWRIQRRMELRRVPLFRDYEALLHDDVAELETLIRGIPIHVTEFFRDAPSWKVLQRDVIPKAFAEAGDAPIRAWTPACATGEEAYSLAILLSEHAGTLELPADFQVFATDTAAEIVARAGRGIFKPAALNGLSPERRQRFFYSADGSFRVKRPLRQKMVFAPHDLLGDPPFTGLDLITCRNLLIYLEPDAAERVIYLLHSSLRLGGYLFLGRGESLPSKQRGFEELAPGTRIYRKVGPASDIEINFPKRPIRLRTPRSSRSAIEAHAHETAAEKHDLPAVLVDENLQIVRLYGDTAPFLRFKPGEPTLNLLSLLTPKIADRLEMAAQEALAQRDAVAVGHLPDPATGASTLVVRLTPLDAPQEGSSRRLLVSFICRSPSGNRGDGNLSIPSVLQTDEAPTDWSEALRLSHEELESSREELQALNQELRASNDQLNLANDDLNAANAQLRSKIQELETQSNVLSSGAVMTLFLDQELRVRWFTPAVSEVFPLTPTDAGRRVTDLVQKFDDDDFVRDVRAVMEKGEPREAEVRGIENKWFIRRIRPYRSATEAAAGVAITFADITEQKRAELALADELDTMSRLHELSDRLLSAELSEALYEVLDTAIALHGAATGTLQMHDTEADVLRYVACRGFDPELLASIPPIDRDFHSTCAMAIRTSQRVVATDFSSEPQFADHASTACSLGYRAAISTPLKTRQEEILGVLTVHFRDVHVPTRRELSWADLYARPAAHLLDRRRAEIRIGEREAEREKVEARLRESEERYRSLFERIDEVSASSR